MPQKFILCICHEKDKMTSYTMPILLTTLPVLWLKVQVFGIWYCVFGEVLGILKGHNASMFRVKHSKNKSDCLTMKMKVVWSLKMLGASDPTRQCHIPEDLSLLQYCCENHKFCILVVLSSNPTLTWYLPCIWLQSCKSCPCGFWLGQFGLDPFWYLKGEKADMVIYSGKEISRATYTGKICHCR